MGPRAGVDCRLIPVAHCRIIQSDVRNTCTSSLFQTSRSNLTLPGTGRVQTHASAPDKGLMDRTPPTGAPAPKAVACAIEGLLRPSRQLRDCGAVSPAWTSGDFPRQATGGPVASDPWPSGHLTSRARGMVTLFNSTKTPDFWGFERGALRPVSRRGRRLPRRTAPPACRAEGRARYSGSRPRPPA